MDMTNGTTMNHQTKLIVSKDLEKTIKDVLCPTEELQKHVAIEPFDEGTYLHESKIIYATFLFITKGGSSTMIQNQQIEEMEKLGYRFVSVDSDANIGMKMTFTKQEKFTTI